MLTYYDYYFKRTLLNMLMFDSGVNVLGNLIRPKKNVNKTKKYVKLCKKLSTKLHFHTFCLDLFHNLV